MSDTDRKKLGLALGGGGSRALTHIGVIAALAEAGLPIHCIAGSSMGAVLGAMYAFDPNPDTLLKHATDYFQSSSLFGRAKKPDQGDGLHPRVGIIGWVAKYIASFSIANILCLRRSLRRRNPAFKAIDTLVPDRDIRDAAIPFSAVAINLTKEEIATFTEGSSHEALKAATSVGVIFPPYQIAGEDYIDAAPMSSVPVRACKELGADIVLAVDIRVRGFGPEPIQHGFDVVRRIEAMGSCAMNDAESAEADLVLRPDVLDIFWGDFTRSAEIVEAGAAAMREKLGELSSLL